MLFLFSWSEILTKLRDGVVSQFVDGLSSGIPKLASALIVFFVGLFIARTVRNLLRRLLSTIGIDRFAERLNEIDIVQRTGVEVKLSNIIAQIVYFVMMLIFIIASTDVLDIPAISQMMRDLFTYLPSLITAAVIFLLGLFLADILRNIVLTTCQSMGISSAKIIASVVFYFLFVTIAVSALAQAKIETAFIGSNLTVLIGAGAAAFAVGYGLASRDLMANYLAGYYNRNKVRIGDDVQIAGERGKVVMMDSTSLILQTHEKAVVVPLSRLTTDKVEIFYPDPQEDHLLDAGQ